ncbi:hypothetical protein QCA50_013846 [Cerrena zonata]|uniref:Uncharacterized protein n=1 Tax=Cerrena zonata TaxID=2478898 RepID=A0AAW0FQ52_9APHY
MDSPRSSMSSHQSHYEQIPTASTRSSAAFTEFSDPDPISPHPTIRITGYETRLDDAVMRTRNTFDNILVENSKLSKKLDKIDQSLHEFQDVRQTVTELSSKVDDLDGTLKTLTAAIAGLERATQRATDDSQASFIKLEQKMVTLDVTYDDAVTTLTEKIDDAVTTLTGRIDGLEMVVHDGFVTKGIAIAEAAATAGQAEIRLNHRLDIVIASLSSMSSIEVQSWVFQLNFRP